MLQVSKELASQHFNKHDIADILYSLGRTNWAYQCNRHQLEYEPWATGLWVKQAGLISYRELAAYIREATEFKSCGLNVKRQSQQVFLVEGRRQPWYTVVQKNGRYSCSCMLYRCRRNRLEKELPQLFKALNQKIFCHHIVAAYYSIRSI